MPTQELPLSKKMWLSVSQAAKLFGVDQKTIRRAVKSRQIAYIIENNRYSIEMGSLLHWAHKSKKLKNKLDRDGIGKFVKEWKEEYKTLKHTASPQNTKTPF